MGNYTMVPEVSDNSNDGMIVEIESPGDKNLTYAPTEFLTTPNCLAIYLSIEMSQRHEPLGLIATIT